MLAPHTHASMSSTYRRVITEIGPFCWKTFVWLYRSVYMLLTLFDQIHCRHIIPRQKNTGLARVHFPAAVRIVDRADRVAAASGYYNRYCYTDTGVGGHTLVTQVWRTRTHARTTTRHWLLDFPFDDARCAIGGVRCVSRCSGGGFRKRLETMYVYHGDRRNENDAIAIRLHTKLNRLAASDEPLGGSSDLTG